MKLWRDFYLFWIRHSDWLWFTTAVIVGIAIIVLSGGPKPIGSSTSPATECGSGIAREIC
jgi:hypothetical protein